MKQLLFLLLFPCLALAQYQGNANQKITLGEQTTADGLVWRGRLADTANLLTNKLDTSVYIVLDTGTRAMWYYRASTTPKWTRLVDSLNNLQGQLSLTSKVTGTLPVANGGTNTGTLTANKVMVGNGTGGVLTPTNLHWDNTNSRLGIGTESPIYKLDISGGNLRMSNNTSILFLTSQGANGSAFTMTSSNNMNIGQPNANFAALNLYGGTGNTNIYAGSASVATFNTDGNVVIGTTNPQSGYRLHVVDSVYVGGNVSASAYTTRSDYDLKDEIQNINYGINEVMQMQPVKYTYKSNGSTQLGFIAQDLGVITPEVVSFEDKMSVYYNALIPILTKAIQEQQALIKALEQRILNLENK